MEDGDFEWDDEKADANRAKHGVTFEEAEHVFADPLGFEFEDTRYDYAEERWVRIGMAGHRLIIVAVNLCRKRPKTPHHQRHACAQIAAEALPGRRLNMKKHKVRRIRLLAMVPMSKAESAAMARRIAAARARNGGPTSDPEIPDEVPAGATVVRGPARRGRPRQTVEGSQPVTLRLPRNVISYFKRGGRGWQTRAVAALTKAMQEEA